MKKKMFRERYRTEEVKVDRNAGEVKIKAVKPRKKVKKGE